MADKLMVVIPCYNEEEVLPETSRWLVEKMAELTRKGLISPESRVLLVDDGSRDRTWELISALHKENPLFEGVKLSRNRGHQNALLAGLMTARGRCDMSISMDADLQDDMDAMDRFIEKYREGCDVVYGVRNRRDTDTAFKRGTALMFYRLMKALGVEMVILSNAAGGLNGSFKIGNLMMIADHISFLGMAGNNPLVVLPLPVED